MRISLGKVQGEAGLNGKDGKDGIGVPGRGIVACNVTYASHASGTSAPIIGWNATIPAITQGQYLWTKTLFTFSDGTQTLAYSVGYHGKDITAYLDGATLHITG